MWEPVGSSLFLCARLMSHCLSALSNKLQMLPRQLMTKSGPCQLHGLGLLCIPCPMLFRLAPGMKRFRGKQHDVGMQPAPTSSLSYGNLICIFGKEKTTSSCMLSRCLLGRKPKRLGNLTQPCRSPGFISEPSTSVAPRMTF